MNTNNYYPEQIPFASEIESWIELLVDHARFMRNGFDPTEKTLFWEANHFSEEFIELSDREFIEIEKNQEYLAELQEEVNKFINFKRKVAQGIENNQILSILPAGLIDHIRREGIFFSGILSRIQDKPRPTWQDIGLPGNRIASTTPQYLIPNLQSELDEITWEELLFWLIINYEHANVLSLYFRPQQRRLRQRTLRWGRRIQNLYETVLRASNRSMDTPERFLEPSRRIIDEWADFLTNIYRQLVNGFIPGQQINIWPRVIDHMTREAIYFIQVLSILGRLYRI
jgi:hypothetical protein